MRSLRPKVWTPFVSPKEKFILTKMKWVKHYLMNMVKFVIGLFCRKTRANHQVVVNVHFDPITTSSKRMDRRIWEAWTIGVLFLLFLRNSLNSVGYLDLILIIVIFISLLFYGTSYKTYLGKIEIAVYLKLLSTSVADESN